MSPIKSKSPDYEQLLAQETLILEVTETIVGLLEQEGISRQELAKRLGKSKGFVSKLLSGEQNMTLRTLADLGFVLQRRFSLGLELARSSEPDPMVRSAAVEDVQTSRGFDLAADAHEYALAA